LEQALVWYRRVADATVKWKQIGAFVGTKTSRECVDRFRACRQAILEKRSKDVSNESANDPPTADFEEDQAIANSLRQTEFFKKGVEEEDVAPGTRENPPGLKRLIGVSLTLSGLILENIGSVSVVLAKFQVSCGRCRAAETMVVSFSGTTPIEEIAGVGAVCVKCNLRMITRFQRKIAHCYDSGVGVVECIECTLLDMLPSDYLISCLSCGAELKFRETNSGCPRNSVCRHCHSKLTISFSSITFTTPSASVAKTQIDDVKNIQCAAAKKKPSYLFKIGSPLPDYGTCKHYKKSFRWLRFPCCGKAFPCDECHDSVEDHECDWASRMICGFCSREQPFSNSKACACGNSLNAKKTSHWEGGKGCRDPTKMSRSDNKKNKLQSRLLRQRVAKK